MAKSSLAKSVRSGRSCYSRYQGLRIDWCVRSYRFSL